MLFRDGTRPSISVKFLPASDAAEAPLTRVDYDLHADSESVAGTAVLTIDVLREGWTRVQVPGGLTVRAARLDGQPVSLVEGPPPYVLLSRAGRIVLSLDIVMPLMSSAGTDSNWRARVSGADYARDGDAAAKRHRPIVIAMDELIREGLFGSPAAA